MDGARRLALSSIAPSVPTPRHQQPLRVVLCAAMYWWNAEAAYAADQAQILARAGHQVWVLTTPNSPNAHQLERRGLALLTNTNLSTQNPFALWRGVRRFRAFLQAQRIQVVNVFRSREFVPVAVACGRFPQWPWSTGTASQNDVLPSMPGPRLVRTRGIVRAMRKSRFNIDLHLNRCDALVAPSQVLRTQWAKSLNIPAERIHCVYQAAPNWAAATHTPTPKTSRKPAPNLKTPKADNNFNPATHRHQLAQQLQLNPSRVWFVVVGRVSPEKGHAPLLHAFAHLQKRWQKAQQSAFPPKQKAQQKPSFPPALLLCTKDDGGELRKHLTSLVQSLELQTSVRWLPFVQNLPSIVNSCDVGVIPSIASEVNCRIAFELMSVGLPVVVFPTGALPEVVVHQQSGLVAPSHLPEALADLLWDIATNPNLRQRLGKQAQQQARERFSPAVFLRETLAILRG